METANILAGTTMETGYKYGNWRIIPDATAPDCFSLKEATTGKVLGSFVLFDRNNTPLLNLIACAPELEDIAEMFHDHMLGGPMQKTILFSLVQDLLNRLKPMVEQKSIKQGLL